MSFSVARGLGPNLLTDGDLIYILRDTFADVVAAGEYQATTSTPDGDATRKSSDTEDKLSGDGSALVCAGGKSSPVFGDPRVLLEPVVAVPRTAGYAFSCAITPTNLNSALVGWSTAPQASINLGAHQYHALRFRDVGLAIYGASLSNIDEYTADTEYNILLVLRSVGMDMLIRGGPFGSTYTRLYVFGDGSDTPLYLSAYNYNLAYEIDHMSVIDLTATPWGDDDGVAHDSLASPSANGTIDAPDDCLIEFSWAPAASEVLELSCRYLDDNNRLYFRAEEGVANFRLYYVTGGVATEFDTGHTHTFTSGNTYRFVIQLTHGRIRSFVDDQIEHDTDSWPQAYYLSGANTVKVSQAGTNLISYPRYITINGIPRTVSEIDRIYAPNATSALAITTYDGSDELTHPDVFDAGSGNTWNGKRYWMTATPYPDGDQSKENPSIWCSDDGTTWTVPAGGSNPIAGPPVSGAYSDPDMILLDDTLWVVWRWHTENAYLAISTTDGVTWSDPITLFTLADQTTLASPALIQLDDGSLLMFSSDVSGSPYKVQRRTCATINGTWSDPVDCSLTLPSGGVWHLDVIRDGNVLYAMCHVRQADAGENGFYLAVSYDYGLSWITQTFPFLVSGGVGQWDEALYRGTIIKNATGFDLWHGGYYDNAGANVWQVGHTTIVFDYP